MLLRRVLTSDDAADTDNHNRETAEGKQYKDLREPLLRLDLAWGSLQPRTTNGGVPQAVGACVPST